MLPNKTIAPAPPSAPTETSAEPWAFSSTDTRPEFFNADRYLS